MSFIEPLESRIAPAGLTYTDVDGDKITITLSKGTFIYFADTPLGGFGKQVTKISINGVDSMGANLTVTATPQRIDGVLRGDGLVSIGTIDATIAGGINLGAVTIDGDLGSIQAGNGMGNFAVKSLSVASLGVYGTATGAPNLESDIVGNLGSLKIAGNIAGAYVRVTGAGSIGSVTVGGNILGGPTANSGSIYASHDLGPVTVKGSVTGGLGNSSGSLGAGFNVASVTIGGSLIGGPGDDSGRIYDSAITPGKAMGAVKIKGDLRGGDLAYLHNAERTGRIQAAVGIEGVTIGGSVFGTGGDYSATIHTGGTIGSLTIGGSIVGFGDHSASIEAAKLQTGKIGGSVVGIGEYGGYLHIDRIESLTIKGDLKGNFGSHSGRIEAEAPGIGKLTIGGSIIGGIDPDYQQPNPVYAEYAGTVDCLGDLTQLTVGGSLIGGSALLAGNITIDGALGSATIGGDLVGFSAIGSGRISIGKSAGTVIIHGSILGGGDQSGELSAYEGISKVVVDGSVIGGTNATESGSITARHGTLGSVSIGGDLRGGRTGLGSSERAVDSGSILAQRIGSVTIGGSIFGDLGATNIRSGAIISDQDIGAVTVEGSLLGQPTNPVKIYAGSPGVIKSITVEGDVSNTLIFAGISDSVSLTGNAQIGPVKVGGDWIASSMGAGVRPGNNGVFGDSDDYLEVGGAASRIASIVIGGQVAGRAGTNDTFAIAAHLIGSFKAGKTSYPLTAGAGTDTWALGKALAVGASLSSPTEQKLDAFAVHVFEI